MEGPTPVSALIHAATMVAAGVYMVGRTFVFYSETALLFIAYIGMITAFMAATTAIVQTDIKRVLAYSTISQLGFMMVGLGTGGYTAGLFHLTTHAFFKALLFPGRRQHYPCGAYPRDAGDGGIAEENAFDIFLGPHRHLCHLGGIALVGILEQGCDSGIGARFRYSSPSAHAYFYCHAYFGGPHCILHV